MFVTGFTWAILVSACADEADSTSDRTPNSLIGGWTNAAQHRLACFARDGRIWFGDSSTEIAGPSHCALSGDGTRFHCSAPEGDAAFDGTLEIAADQLHLAIEPCPSSTPDDCNATYQRDASVRCQ
jgi:hypothetical protein